MPYQRLEEVKAISIVVPGSSPTSDGEGLACAKAESATVSVAPSANETSKAIFSADETKEPPFFQFMSEFVKSIGKKDEQNVVAVNNEIAETVQQDSAAAID
jgi:hypothetical protein